jgi:hypothetical protein
MSTMTVGQAKVTRGQLDRLAVIYVRQSTLAQVRDHGESTLRQYALVEDAERLGWPAERILVIDTPPVPRTPRSSRSRPCPRSSCPPPRAPP